MNVSIILMIIGTFLAPLGVLLELDPITVSLSLHFPNLSAKSFPVYIIQTVITYLLVQWCTLESTRVYITILLPTIATCHIYLKCLKEIACRRLCGPTLILYNQLYCINQIGIEFVKAVAGAMLGIGFCILVVGNWVVIRCYGVLPVEIYLLVLGVLLVVYFFDSQTIPYAIQSNELSEKVQQQWKMFLFFKMGRIGYWSRVVASMRSISFYYAMTRFEKSTKTKYYATIVEYTVTLLILVKRY